MDRTVYFKKIFNLPKKVGRKIKERFFLYEIVKNVYRTNYSKNCLIQYIITPFFNPSCSHTNQQMALAIARVFHEKGFNIDAVQYNCKRKINYDRYDVVFGFGGQFDEFLAKHNRDNFSSKPIVIAFLTGASPYYSNIAELNRLAYFKKRNNASLLLRRQVSSLDGLMDLSALQNVSAAICTGNDWTVSTWRNMVENIYKITPTGFDRIKLSDIHRNINEAKKNFLWFSGAGMLHKGLDLCIEAFRGKDNLQLYVAGVKDDDFFSFYEKDFESANIHYCGFIDISSNKYKEIVEKCLFCIFPSCSEGGASSVLTAMFTGMIPVVVEQASVDIGDFGIKIENIEVDSLKKVIKMAAQMDNDELRKREEKAYLYAMKNHTVDRFKEDFGNILDSIMI